MQDCEELPKRVGKADRGKTLHADSGYAGRPRHLEEQGVKGRIHEKAEAKKPLGGIYQRRIGLVRNAHQTGMMNLAHNLCRYVQLQRALA